MIDLTHLHGRVILTDLTEGDAMTLEQLAYLAEIVGVIIVVITLLYLAVQVRQGANLLRSESRQAMLNNTREHL